MSPATINLGFFPDWKGTHTLLFCADVEALTLLASPLLELSMSRRHEIKVHELPFVRAHGGVSVVAQRVSVDAGALSDGASGAFRWARSPDGWAAVLYQVRSLIDNGPGHHDYLDGPSDEVTVEFSVGEYTDELWQRQA